MTDITLLSWSGVRVQDIVYQEIASFVNELGTLAKLRRLLSDSGSNTNLPGI